MPRNAVDLAISKKISKYFEIKAGIKDILNQQVRFTQTVNTSVNMNELPMATQSGTKYFNKDQIIKSYYPGRYTTLSITYKF